MQVTNGHADDHRMSENSNPFESAGDESLVTRALEGDREAFFELFRRNGAKDFAFLAAATGSRTDAANLVEEIWGNIARELPDYRGDKAFATWRTVFIRDAAKNYLRGRYRNAKLINKFWFEYLPDTPDKSLPQKTRAWVERVQGKLDSDERKIIRMRIHKKHSLAESAEILGISEEEARVSLFRALRTASEVGALVDDELGTSDKQPLQKRADHVDKYVSGLVHGDVPSDVGKMFGDSDLGELRAAHAFAFALVNDADLLPDDHLSEKLFHLVWQDLEKASLKHEKKKSPFLARHGLRPITLGLATIFAGLLALVLVVGVPPAPLSQEETLGWTGTTAVLEDQGFGPAAGLEVNDSILDALGGGGIIYEYEWRGGDFPAFPAQLPVYKVLPRDLDMESVNAWALRMGVPELLGQTEVDPEESIITTPGTQSSLEGETFDVGSSFVFGSGTVQDPEPGQYRLLIDPLARRMNLLYIGEPGDLFAFDPDTFKDKLTVAVGARDYLNDLTLLARFHSGPRITLPEMTGINAGSVGPAQIAYGQQLDGYSVLSAGGQRAKDMITMVAEPDGNVLQLDTELPFDMERSDYELIGPGAAIDEVSKASADKDKESDQGFSLIIPALLTDIELAYMDATDTAGNKYLIPVFVMSGTSSAGPLVDIGGPVSVVTPAIK